MGGKLALVLMAPAVLLFLAVFLWPLVDLLARSVLDPSLTLEHYRRLVEVELYGRVLWRTVWISAVVTLLALLLGYPVAYAMARARGVWVFVIGACVLVPLWSSVLVRSYAWTALLARRGLVNDALMMLGIVERPLRILYTDVAVIIAMTHVLLPFMVLPLFAALRNVRPELSNAARALGASEWRVFQRIVLPLSAPGIYAGSVLVFLLALGFFVTPALVGGPQSLMMATLIVDELTTSAEWGFAAALSTTVLLLALLIVVAFGRLLAADRLAADGR